MINNNPGGRLWVDPDGVEGLGLAYEGHVELYDSYLSQLTALRSRYANAWGDDDMGKQFSTKFLEGIDNLEAIIGGVKGTLAYTSAGLTESARAYREADEAAAEVTGKMSKSFEGLDRPLPAVTPAEGSVRREAARTTRHAVRATTNEDGTVPLQPMLAARLPATPATDPETGQPLLQRARTVEGQLLEPVTGERQQAVKGRTLEPAEGAPFYSSRKPVEPAYSPLLPAEPGLPLEPTQSHARSSYHAATPAMPAISSMYMQPSYSTAHVGGEPLPQGYQLISLNPFEDGSTRVDANLYDSVTPLTGAAVTNPDGTVIDPGKGQFFVVKENPKVDPTATGYEPFVLSYAADGTPTPIYTGF
ncbi:hypothetical protein [Actinoplanes derwentensis]|uniref:Uncharacterized protein n=1 Tax=Actinoplanes derwentensis TaxID=113562 RepID=A0A1H2BEP3_9ACTN|nr:hypothetical protein [Actinoplanes derwentensis]GID90493.1 hypothetical protein Ade03nite_94170 [Actinoplanes derwentensis]SDT56359.1 hypothetical protein SAMN04489716_4539 [Actinoplanes derwentensis]